MIYCPECGTGNQDGSGSCSECGQVLGTQMHVTCHQCGALNPVENVLCSECKEPLLPSPTSTSDESTPTVNGPSLPGTDPVDREDKESTAASTPEPEDEIPTWLRELGITPTEDGSPADAAPLEDASEIPDWLRDLRASLPEEQEAEMGPAEEPEEVPDWVTELQPSDAEAEPEPIPPPIEAGEEEMPDWLAELEALTTAEEEEERDRLAETQPPAAAEEPEPVLPVSDAEEEELPDWLAELRSSVVEEEQIEPAFEAEEGEIPEWLAELQPSAAEEGPESSLPAFEAEEEERPEWLIEAEPSTAEEEPLAEIPADEIPSAPAVPEWVTELQAEAPEEAPSPVEETAIEAESLDWLVPSEAALEDEESLARAEIPAWLLALKPAELQKEGADAGPPSAAGEPIEETGLLAGLPGILPVEMVIAQPRATIAAEVLETPSADSQQARLFAEILGGPAEAEPERIAPSLRRVPALLPRWTIYIVLIVAVSIPLLLGEPLIPRTIEPPSAMLDLYDSIESLDSNAPVLVAFDYDPTTTGEMDILAQALVGHLMDRGARTVAVSLLPAGAATAQSMLDKLAIERADYADSYGKRYANLGYLPGQATAVRLLSLSIATALPRDFQATPVTDLAVMDGLITIQSFDLIVELAASQDTLRWWIEQAGRPYSIPTGAGVSASVDPLARPYYETESRQLVGMVGGVPGAAIYEALRSDQDSPTETLAARLDSQLAGHLVLILVLLIGNGIFLVQRGTRREQ